MPARSPPQRSPGMTHLHQRLQRLEAQAWEGEGRRLGQVTEAELDPEIVRVETHYGASIQEYECFVETLSASELEALCTADLATMRRFLHAFQRWRNGGSCACLFSTPVWPTSKPGAPVPLLRLGRWSYGWRIGTRALQR